MLLPRWQKAWQILMVSSFAGFPFYYLYCIKNIVSLMLADILTITGNNFHLVAVIFLSIAVLTDFGAIFWLIKGIILNRQEKFSLYVLVVIMLFTTASFRILPEAFLLLSFINSALIFLVFYTPVYSMIYTAGMSFLYYFLEPAEAVLSMILFGLVFIFVNLIRLFYEASQSELSVSFEKAKWAASELSQLTQRINHFREVDVKKAQISERLHIAREIHDTVGYALTAMQVQLNALQDLQGTELYRKIGYLENLARTTLSETRMLVNSMRINTKAGVEKCWIKQIKSLTETFSNCTGTRIRLEYYDVESFPDEIGRVVYQCIQEAITNAYRHGSAAYILIQMRYKRELSMYLIKISDNGSGCRKLIPGSGLKGMKERIAGLSGSLIVDPQHQKKFSLFIDIPCKEPASHD